MQYEQSTQVLSNPDLRGSTWVMFHEPTVKLDELFGDLPLPFNYEFLVASPSPGDLIVLKEVYRVEHSFPLTVSRFGSWGRGVGFLGPKNSLYERRNDFQGLLFRTANLNLSSHVHPTAVVYSDGRTEHKVPEDRAYGSVDRNGTWNGMVGMLVRGEVDLVVGTLTMTSQRLDAVRFSVPLVSSTFRLFIRQPENYSLRWGNFLAPFSCALWLLRVVFVVVFATLFTILHKLGRRYGSPELEGPKLTLYEVAFYIYGAFFCSQSTPISPRSSSCQLVFLMMHMTTVVFAVAYSASLVSSLSVKNTMVPFNSVQGLLEDETYSLEVTKYSAEYSMFQAWGQRWLPRSPLLEADPGMQLAPRWTGLD
uniref:Uncharacterized protein n=1 Tax=Timema genevievae TaxID=629358 RepID=A0A7R9PN28_TIMGE|nr:unnamed protein product [Timema genevievae]